MVVAGPGTGKTQVLSLRIANILQKTDTGADGILCLTFTNSGVRAMRNRLFRIIGKDATKVHVSTFHSFALELVEKNYNLLGFSNMPELLDDAGSVAIFDDLLENNDWDHLRPRSNSTQYFYDVKSLISLLKRENITPEDFLNKINLEIESLKIDPSSISTRGESKGQIKKEVQTRIESLERSSEVVKFYSMYESYKKESGYIDYDDVLRLMVDLVNLSDDVRSEIKENFLYVLVDEHQDSSGVQNEFLKRVWHDAENPNIFVVGDDRQLIYGFGGASIEYFENFKNMFGRAELITLTENYRSTQNILDTADSLLKSSISKQKLNSQYQGGDVVKCVQAPYPRDEIILAGIDIKNRISAGLDPNEIAILVPKNFQVRNAITILSDMGLPVAKASSNDLLLSPDARIFISVLKIVLDPYSSQNIAEYVLSRYSKIPPIQAHAFLRTSKNLSVDSFSKNKASSQGFFKEQDAIFIAGSFLVDSINYGSLHTVYETVQYIGDKLLLDTANDHSELTERAEVVRTMLHLALILESRKNQNNLKSYLEYLDRLFNYGQHIPIAVFGKENGIKVLTMHASKGLEFEYVWVAHVDEKSLHSSKRGGFALPESVAVLEEIKDDMVVKRQVYVAMTRAKKYCNLSYAKENYSGAELELAHIFKEIDDGLIEYIDNSLSEKVLIDYGVKNIVTSDKKESIVNKLELAEIVKNEYEKTKVAVTLLNNFFECPWKWYFRNLLKLPQAKSSSLTFGSVVHSCIESILNHNGKITDKFISEIITDSLNKNNVIDKNEIRRITKDATNLLNEWVEKRLPEISKNHESEKDIAYKDAEFPHLHLYGKIDLTERMGDGVLRVTDFKTGSSKTRSAIEKDGEEGRLSSYLRQLAMYSYLIQGNSKNTKVSESVLEFLEEDVSSKNAIYSTTITDEHIELLRRDIKEYDELLKSGEWVNRPCYAKNFGTNTVCEYCELADKIYGK
jgi:DNA helicase-2/ATP-dependent DNA helicase PcrA